ncbi:pantoate--beta-alanine ligase [Marinitenerispora sediminis]|uniref:Pantothenate synthetase n=1 Tax=Marinitenerispora sediminis TaxID=1931232 RepID=A0A368T5I4_9ACTN|nr:pantoate--beta-alanine ligase [Marinitenerispora sediminis]RCV55152.1 pantoate--beta-alanine ligase [Marinitenerispora sediminis]RCV58945.1 pantoate--beta-alanine ligase [Marinitenerispora sediminis]RCV61509.1 pantoate--beta-alanine ligase [Marinitenerispora sediminis]
MSEPTTSDPAPAPGAAGAGPLVVRTAEELARARAALGTRRTALVPTMGALHSGHRRLVATAREHADAVVVSIFVNPLQFGPNEDFDRYPRPLEADLAVCAEAGVDVVFAPTVEVMYPGPQIVTVRPGAMGEVLEGEFRPGFFEGVLTVVSKLFNLVRPDVAVFGQKDAQQLAVVRRMVRDLCMPVHVVGAATVRDPDGLATSSRNVYLSAEERRSALALSRALLAGADAAVTGAVGILSAAREVLDEAATADPPVAVDYLSLVNPVTFTEVSGDFRGDAVLVVAAWVGETRLIDNVPLTL